MEEIGRIKNVFISKLFYLRYLIIIYLLLILFLRFFRVDVFFLSLLSVPLFIIIPQQLGKFGNNIIKKIKTNDIFIFFTLQWCIGLILIYIIAIIINFFNIFFVYYYIIIILLIISTFIPNEKISNPPKKDFLFIGLTILIGFLACLYYRARSPYPYQYGWDIFVHQSIIDRLILDNFFSINLTDYSSQFIQNTYTPIYHLIISIIIFITQIDLLYFLWFIIFLAIPIFSLGMYLLFYEISKDRLISIIAVIIGSIALESGTVANLFFFLPSTIIMLIFPFSLYMTIKLKNSSKKVIFLVLFIWFIIFLMIHWFTGPIAFSILILYLIISKCSNKINKNIYFLSSILLLSITSLIIFNIYKLNFSIDIINNLNSNLFIKSPLEKIELLTIWFSKFIIILSFLGLLFSIILNRKKELSLEITYLIYFILFLIPMTYIHRIAILIHLFISFYASFFIINIKKYFIKTKIIKVIFVSLFLIILLFNLSIVIETRYNLLKQWGDTDNMVTSFMSYEYNMALWIKENTSKNSLFISEPATQNVIGSISKRQTLRGTYPNESEMELINTLIETDNSRTAYDLACGINRYGDKYIIIGGRVDKWVANRNSSDITWRVWVPNNFKAYPGYFKFYDTAYFKLEHEEEKQIYLFKVLCNN